MNQEEMLLTHCRTRFHLKRYSSEKLRKQVRLDNYVLWISDNRENCFKEKKQFFYFVSFMINFLRAQKEEAADQTEIKVESTSANDAEISDQEEQSENFWADENDKGQKLSEDEEDSKSEIRYDRFGHSDEKENMDKQKSSIETDVGDTSKNEKSNE